LCSGDSGGDGDSCCFGAVADAELDEDVAEVSIRRAFADEESLGEFTIRPAPSNITRSCKRASPRCTSSSPQHEPNSIASPPTGWTAPTTVMRVVDLACDVVGGASFRRGHELERLSRDVRAARFHPGTDMFTHESIGKALLGIDPAGPLW
jgi:hypothetical protein